MKGGIGVGSASIVLVFAVLCLSIFTIITLSSATSDKAMAEAAEATVLGYYEADTLAECILADILTMNSPPETIRGVAVSSYWDMDLMSDIISFACPVSDAKELYVEISVFDGTYEVVCWSMRDVGDWSIDGDLPIWTGDSGDMSDLWSGE